MSIRAVGPGKTVGLYVLLKAFQNVGCRFVRRITRRTYVTTEGQEGGCCQPQRIHRDAKKIGSACEPRILNLPILLEPMYSCGAGITRCPKCGAEFEIADKAECMFADTENIRLPINDIICGSCGLVQGANRKSCL